MLRQRGRSGLGRLPWPAALCGPCACLACSRPSVSVRQVYAFSARALVLLFPVSPSPARLKQPCARPSDPGAAHVSTPSGSAGSRAARPLPEGRYVLLEDMYSGAVGADNGVELPTCRSEACYWFRRSTDCSQSVNIPVRYRCLTWCYVPDPVVHGEDLVVTRSDRRLSVPRPGRPGVNAGWT